MGPVGELVVRECKASEFKDCDVVFSGLDADVAGDIGTYPFVSYMDTGTGELLPRLELAR